MDTHCYNVHFCIFVFFPVDIPQVLVIQQEMREWRSNLDQNAPEPLYIKEEQEELWSSQEGQYLEGPEKSPFPGAPVKGDSQKGQQQSYPSILNGTNILHCVLKGF